MKPEATRRLAALIDQLAETLMAASLCAGEIRAALRAEPEDNGNESAGWSESRLSPAGSSHQKRPLLDESTLCVIWRDKSLFLGHTVVFRLLNRLARRPNQYVTHLSLLHDVWDDEERATATIRSVVRHLRQKLRDSGMGELAAAIRGHNGRYILEL